MERVELSRMLAAGSSRRAIGQALSRAPSTLSRELARQHASPVTYRAVLAQQRAQRWSPEQIAARGLPQRYPHEPTMRISHEAIDTYF
jgi:transposase, IS30 family